LQKEQEREQQTETYYQEVDKAAPHLVPTDQRRKRGFSAKQKVKNNGKQTTTTESD
jgi:hypothetical protein